MPIYQPNQPEYYPEPSPENGGYKMLNVIMCAGIRTSQEYENVAFQNEENLKAFLYSNLAYKADAAKDLEGLYKLIPELKVDPKQAEERRQLSALARENISDVASRKYFSSIGYGKDREMRILMSYDSSPAGREANAKLFDIIMNGSPEERGQLIEKRIKDAMELFNYVMNGNPTDAYLVEHFEQLFSLQELASSAQMIRKDANRKDISRPFVLSQEAIDSLNLLELYSTDVEMKTQRVKMISNADYEHLNLPYLLTCDDHVFKKLENFIGSDVNEEMGENTALKGSLTQLEFHATTDWSRKLLCGQRQKQLMHEIEEDFGADKDKVTIKLAGKEGSILESPYTLSGAHEYQTVANNLTKGYVSVTSPTGDAICYRLNLDGSVKKASAAEMLSDMPYDAKVMLDMMEEANKGFFIGSKEYSTALKNMQKAFATVQELGNPPSPEKMDQAAAYYKTILEQAEKYTEKKLSRPPTPKEQELIDQLDDYVFGPDDIIEAMSPREKLRFDTMKQATTFCKQQLAQLTLQRDAAEAELSLGEKAAAASKQAKLDYDDTMITESNVGTIADELRADINFSLQRMLNGEFEKSEAQEIFSNMVLLEVITRGRTLKNGVWEAGPMEIALAEKPESVVRSMRNYPEVKEACENLTLEKLCRFVQENGASTVAKQILQNAKEHNPAAKANDLQLQNEQQMQKQQMQKQQEAPKIMA